MAYGYILVLKVAIIATSGPIFVILNLIVFEALGHVAQPIGELLGKAIAIALYASGAMLAGLVPMVVFGDFLGSRRQRINWQVFSAGAARLDCRDLRHPVLIWRMAEKARYKNQ